MKMAMSTTPVLALPNFTQAFIIETDACDLGIGAVLLQNGHPIAYYSKALGPINQKLSIYEKEFLAIIMAVDKWRSYLQRGPFTIRTDHKSLCNLEDQQLTSELQKKAMTKLIGLQYKFQYKKGEDNKVADALSRVGHTFEAAAMSGCQPVWLQEILNSYQVDSHAQNLLSQLVIHSPDSEGFSLTDGLIRQHGRIWVGSNVGLQTKIIHTLHSTPIGGHSGIQQTYQRIKKLFIWKGLKHDVENFVRQCSVCQQAKHEHCGTPGLLNPLKRPEKPWDDITMDFIEGLPKSNGYNAILVVVDRYTKYAHFLPLRHPFTAPQVAKLFMDHVVKLHSIPLSIVSDRDKIFTSSFWRELFKLLNTQLQLSTAYHPQTDGQSERVDQCLEQYLRCATQATPTKWVNWIPMAEFWYNTSFHTSIGCSPYKALYNQEPNYGMLPDFTTTDNSEVIDTLHDREMHSAMLRQNLARAQLRMKHNADSKRTPREFQVGEQVYLKLQPYVQNSVVHRPSPKLSYKFFGPYEILARIGPLAYKLALPAESQVHPVFHVSQLKQHVPDHTPVFVSLPQPLELDSSELFPEAVLDRRLVKKGNAAYLQVLVQWSSLPTSMATWEDYEVLRKRYPKATAWGQSASQGAGNVMTGSATPSDNTKEAEQVAEKTEAATTTNEGPSSSS